jgi:hypothetical protein
MGEWRKLHNEELHDLYFLPSVITIIKSGRMRWACRLLVGKPEGKSQLVRPRCRWVNNIKIDLLEIGWGGVGWIGLAQYGDKWRALVNAVMNLRVP